MQPPRHSHTGDLGKAARGLAQQMVWWGCDVRHPSGNMLVRYGMGRTPSPGLTGTSCYQMGWEGGWIELHGAAASWTSGDSRDGMVFTRDRGRIALWNGERPPVPGLEYGHQGSVSERWEAALPMLRWIAGYEKWIDGQLGPQWRQACRRHIRRLPRGKPWLAPKEALDWWHRAAATEHISHTTSRIR